MDIKLNIKMKALPADFMGFIKKYLKSFSIIQN